MNSNIQDYIDLVRSGKIEVCKDQLLLCDMVERVFSTEDIYVDEEQLNKYLNQQKYFPFQLYEWERFCFARSCCWSARTRPMAGRLSPRGFWLCWAAILGRLSLELFCTVL